MHGLGRLFLSFAGVAAAAALPASAGTLQAASTFVQCSADGNSAFDPTECTVGGIPGVPSSSSASAKLAPVPLVEAHAASPANGVFGAGTSASGFYSFQVTGGNVGDVVPVLIDANLNASSTPDSSASAKLIINTVELGTTPLVLEVCTGECAETSFGDTLSVDTKSGSTADSVTLYVTAQATATQSSNETADAFADPYLYVDPAFPDAGLYSIVVSPGVENVPVPEPANIWLMGTALGVFGLARRRQPW